MLLVTTEIGEGFTSDTTLQLKFPCCSMKELMSSHFSSFAHTAFAFLYVLHLDVSLLFKVVLGFKDPA